MVVPTASPKNLARLTTSRVPVRRRWPRVPMAALLLFALALIPAGASDASQGVQWGLFGTLGYNTNDHRQMAVLRDISQNKSINPTQQSARDAWLVDSRLGVQLRLDHSPQFSVVGQVLARHHYNPSVSSAFELLYMEARTADGRSRLRLGRSHYDAFLMADHRNVGYAYPWVRPPQEFYSWIPIFHVDGIDVSHLWHTADANWRVSGQFGSHSLRLRMGEGPLDFETRDLFTLSLTRETPRWRLKTAYSQFSSTREAPFGNVLTALDGIAASASPDVAAEAALLRQNLTMKGTQLSYLTFGATYDDHIWFAQGEWSRVMVTPEANIIPHGDNLYLSVGRRFGPVMAFAIWSRAVPANGILGPRADWGEGPLGNPLRDGILYNLNASRNEQTTYGVGVRWDVHPQAAVKVQLNHIRVQPFGNGFWVRDRAVVPRQNNLNQLTLTLDFALW